MCREPTPYFEMGLVIHEIMRSYGAPELFDEDEDEDPILLGGVASFSNMANPYGWTRDPKICSHIDAYSRIANGWLEPIEITKNGFYAIQPSEISGVIYKISAGYPSGEYLLIENRQAIKWDADWSSTGLVIYHIDEQAPGMLARGFPGHPNWPADHYIVAVQQADGKYDLEKGENIGDAGDFWQKGMVFGPNEDGNTWPNSDAYQGGNVQKTGIRIEVMTKSGFVMRFKVDGIPDGGSYGPDLVPVDPMSFDEEEEVQPVLGTSHVDDDPSNVNRTLTWVLSVLGGIAATVGILAFFLIV